MQQTVTNVIRVNLLGEFEILPSVLQGDKQKQLLALLVLARWVPEFKKNGEISRDWLAHNLYQQVYIQQRVSALNLLSKVIVGVTENLNGRGIDVHKGYLIANAKTISADIDDFYNTSAQGDLQEAVKFWKGPLLADLSYDWQHQDWYQAIRADLDQKYLMILHQLSDREISKRQEARTGGFAPEKVEPYRQEALKLLTRALNYVNMVKQAQPEAEWFAELEKKITRSLNELLMVAPIPCPLPPAPMVPPDDIPNNLPEPLTSFISREKQTAEIHQHLTKMRMLTLTGSGGCGKTRLGLQAAAEVREQFPDGVWFVELANLDEPARVAQTVAFVLDVTAQRDQPFIHALIQHLKARKLLLLLDNCEHLLTACTQLSYDLLRLCPNVKILATSRQGLGVTGEQTYRVPSLSLPDPRQPATVTSIGHFEAVRLFIERALLSNPEFAFTDGNAPAVASICQRLDGIPFALELAAIHVRSSSVEEINAQLGDRFHLLTRGSKTALPRQQTLRALIDWSYDLLNNQEQILLCRLSVFAGGWTLKAAEHVGSGAEAGRESIEKKEVLTLLTDLVDKSLVLAHTHGEVTRYSLLQTMRQYASERLRHNKDLEGEDFMDNEERIAATTRHGEYFLNLAEEARLQLGGADQAKWLCVLEAENDNLRQALVWYTEQGKEDSEAAEMGLRLGTALQGFWETRGLMSEGRERIAALLALPRKVPPTKACANALNCAGGMAFMQGDYVQARSLYEESQALQRELGDKKGLAASLDNLGLLEYELGNYIQAHNLHEESLALRRELGNKNGIAISLLNLGDVVQQQEDYARAYLLYQDSLAIWQELKDDWGIAYVKINLGIWACEQGKYVQAHSLLESITVLQQMDDRRAIAYGLEAFAALALRKNLDEACAILWGAAATLREAIASPLSPLADNKRAGEMVGIRQKLGEDAFTAAQERGHAMSIQQAIEYALIKTA